MPRDKYSLPIHQVHIADGFTADCDEIVQRCLELKTLDFKEFTKVWKEMNFDLLYEGRTTGSEIAELSEELIHIAKHYMVKDTSFFEESVTGLFLVYSLLNLQPFSGFACLRLVPDDVRAVNRIELVARRERRLDVLYILGEVLIKWTQYHADGRPRGMEGVIKKYLEGCTSIDKLGVRPMGVFYRQNEELDHIRDLASMTRQYMLAKTALFNDGCKDPTLQYINGNLASELNTSLRKLVSGVLEDNDDQDTVADPASVEEKTSQERSSTVQAIKAKAMANAVDPMNHLTSAENRKQARTTRKISSDLKKPTGKIKTGTLTRPTTTSPKKRKTEAKRKQKPKDDWTDSEDDSDLQIDEFYQISDDSDDTDDDNDRDNDERNQENKKQEQVNTETQYGNQSIGFDIESLPLILRTGDFGPDIEIEIIDHTKPKGNKIEPTSTCPITIIKTPSPSKTNKIPSSPKTTKTPNSRKATKSPRSPTKSTKTPSSKDDEPLLLKAGMNFLKTYKKKRKDAFEELTDGFPLKKKEKKNQIRRDLKSRFTKLGMLSLANLDHQDKEI